MKKCELCKYPARMYCESDEANLCWDCDVKVHCANFLVARHPRSLLCHVCQSTTPWKASGAKLEPTVSICKRCAYNSNSRVERDEVDEEGQGANGGNDEIEKEPEDDDDDDDDDDGDDIDDVEDGGDGDEEDGENQVVPWSSTPPPPVTNSSISE